MELGVSASSRRVTCPHEFDSMSSSLSPPRSTDPTLVVMDGGTPSESSHILSSMEETATRASKNQLRILTASNIYICVCVCVYICVEQMVVIQRRLAFT
jgi:hypothetical protein